MSSRAAIVIPTLVESNMLSRAIESVMKQTVEADEIQFSFVPGIARARNAMIADSDAEFIVPLDADDWIAPTFIEQCLEKAMAWKVGIVTTYLEWPDGRVQQPKEPFTVEHFLEENCVFGCSMFRRTAWEEVGGYDEYLRTYEDWDLWIRIVKAGWQVAVVPEPLFHYCPAPNCSSARMKPGDHAEYVRYIREKHHADAAAQSGR